MKRFVLALALLSPAIAAAQIPTPPKAPTAPSLPAAPAAPTAPKVNVPPPPAAATDVKNTAQATGQAATAKVGAAATDAKTQGAAAVTGAQATGAATVDSAKTKAAGVVDKAKGAAGKLLDLNTASVDQLKAVPGLGDAAQKIVDGRPWANKAQLVAKKVISKETYDKVKDLVVAKKVAATSAAKAAVAK